MFGKRDSPSSYCRQYTAPAPSPDMQGKALRFQIRIHTMPFIGGQPLPRRLLTCPALADVAAAVPDPSHRASCSISPVGGYHRHVSAPCQKEPRRRGVGVVPGSYSRHWWPVAGQTVTVPLSDVRQGLPDEFKPVSAWTVTLSLCRAKTAPASKSGGTVEFEIRAS